MNRKNSFVNGDIIKGGSIIKKYSHKLTVVMLAIILSFVTSKAKALTLDRSYGEDRYKTAAAISRDGWTTSDYAIIANGENFPDALCAAPLAAYYNAPILLTSKDSLTVDTLNELARLKVKKVFVIGGTGVVSDSIISSILNIKYQGQSSSVNCERIYGKDRFETSLEVAKRLPKSDKITVVSGENFPDSLSMAPFAAKNKMPIILVSRSEISSELKNFIHNNNITKTYIIGGSGVIDDSVANEFNSTERIWGQDRYETNINVIQRFSGETDLTKLYIASGENFPDGLAGSALAPKSSSPIVLTSITANNGTRDFVSASLQKVSTLKILGGEGVVPLNTVQNLLIDRHLGNSAANTNSRAVVASSNGSVYYSNSGGIKALKPDGSQKQILEFTNNENINATDRYIFYINLYDNCKLYRMNVDGSDNKRINNDHGISSFVIYDNYIYYVNTSDSDKIYRMDLNGANVTKLTDDIACNYLNVNKDYIYYTAKADTLNGGSLNRMNRDGSNRTVIWNDSCTSPVVWGNSIYYTDNIAVGNINKINIDGTGHEKLNDDKSSNINIIGDTIYYLNWSDSGKIYSIRTDGTSRAFVKDDKIDEINTVGDTLYYVNNVFTGPLQNIKVKEHAEDAFNADKNERGNSISNIINGSFVASKGDYIYEKSSYDRAVYRYKEDGSERTKVLDDNGVIEMNVSGDWLYFTDQYKDNADSYYHIVKIKADGTGSKTLLSNDKAYYLTVVGDWIYYTTEASDSKYSKEGRINKIRTDGTGHSLITDDYALDLNVIGDWIYYINTKDNNNIYKVRTDGTERTKVYDKSVAYLLLTEDGSYAYFADGVEGHPVYRMSLKDNSVIPINSQGYMKSITFVDNKIYYVDSEKIYSCNLDGTSKELLTDCYMGSNLNLAGDYLYFSDKSSEQKIDKIKVR